ncbi:MAG: hypothetical protein WDZ49_09605 [Litorilinea sp.]
MTELLDSLSEWLDLEQLPSADRLFAAMDPVAWTLAGLLVGAVILGIFFSLSTRRTFSLPESEEAGPGVLLAQLKQDPTTLSPVAILSRLGAEATLELLEYGDQIQSAEWRYGWNSVREELLRLMGRQDAFGPTYALARYGRSADAQEPDTIRIRRTVLIHKLGLRRRLDPNPDGTPAQLRIRCHSAEITGDLGFEGETFWLMPDEPAPTTEGPLIEMEPVEFRTVQDAQLHLHIRRTPTVGGGFRIELKKRRKMWVVVNEEIEWVS